MRWTGLITDTNTSPSSKLYSTSYPYVNASQPPGLNISCPERLIAGTALSRRMC